MSEQSEFSIQLRKYLKMIISIWPSLRPGLKNLSDINSLNQSTFLPQHSYNTMSEQLFLTTIINDMHTFIMQHDVKQQDLQDYFYDILGLLSITEQITAANSQVGGVRYMSNQLYKIITELQNDNKQTVQKFQNNIYNPVIEMGIGDALQQNMNIQQSDESGSNSQQNQQEQMKQQNWQDDQNQQQQQQKQHKQKGEEQLLKQKQLEDDGWVIVKKK